MNGFLFQNEGKKRISKTTLQKEFQTFFIPIKKLYRCRAMIGDTSEVI